MQGSSVPASFPKPLFTQLRLQDVTKGFVKSVFFLGGGPGSRGQNLALKQPWYPLETRSSTGIVGSWIGHVSCWQGSWIILLVSQHNIKKSYTYRTSLDLQIRSQQREEKRKHMSVPASQLVARLGRQTGSA